MRRDRPRPLMESTQKRCGWNRLPHHHHNAARRIVLYRSHRWPSAESECTSRASTNRRPRPRFASVPCLVDPLRYAAPGSDDLLHLLCAHQLLNFLTEKCSASSSVAPTQSRNPAEAEDIVEDNLADPDVREFPSVVFVATPNILWPTAEIHVRRRPTKTNRACVSRSACQESCLEHCSPQSGAQAPSLSGMHIGDRERLPSS